MQTSQLIAFLTSPKARLGWKFALGLGIAFTLWMALIPAPPKSLSTGWDKSDHLGAFAVLAIAGRIAWGSKLRNQLALGAYLVALGILIEVMQMFVPLRQADWHDVVADALGVVLGLAIAFVLAKFSRATRRSP